VWCIKEENANSTLHETRKQKNKYLEVLVEVEATGVLFLLLFIFILLRAVHDASFLVVTDTLLEEVGLSGKGDVLHEVEGVGGVVVLLVTKSNQETVSYEFNVLAHQLGVHSKQGTWESIGQELLLDRNSIDDDVLNDLLTWTSVEVGEEQAGKVGVKTLVTRNQLVGESQTGHQATLLQPENGSEGTREENSLDSREGNESLGEGRLLIGDPAQGPVSLLANARNCKRLEK
jgi:hypothetical protein